MEEQNQGKARTKQTQSVQDFCLNLDYHWLAILEHFCVNVSMIILQDALRSHELMSWLFFSSDVRTVSPSVESWRPLISAVCIFARTCTSENVLSPAIVHRLLSASDLFVVYELLTCVTDQMTKFSLVSKLHG